MVKAVRIFLGIAILASVIICSCVIPSFILPGGDDNIDGGVYLSDGSYSVGGDGEPIILIDNPGATDPTYAEMMAFIVEDPADTHDYVERGPKGHVCADFAEAVHNNAEAAGIRCAWVSVDFEGDEEGHALNAFNTTDKGLVYVDCTGKEILLFPFYGELDSYDKIAYVKVGKEYGLISADKATLPEYSFYELYSAEWDKYSERLESYNKEVDRYNDALGGRTSLEEPEYSMFSRWHEELEQERRELETLEEKLGDRHWESPGTVSSIEVIWEGR